MKISHVNRKFFVYKNNIIVFSHRIEWRSATTVYEYLFMQITDWDDPVSGFLLPNVLVCN